MKSLRSLPIIAGLAILFFMSCSSTEQEVLPENDLEDLVLFGEYNVPKTDINMKIYQYTEELFTGYNRFEFLLEKDGFEGIFTDAQISLTPIMDMNTMQHSCPVEQPIAGLNHKGVFGAAVVFVMPGGDMGNWSISITVKDNESENEGSLVLPMQVKMPEQSRLKSFTLNEAKYFVSYVKPYDPEVGINDFEIAIHKKESMMDWPSANDFIVSMDPEMPDMGHGSPNNVNPIHTFKGHYLGKVNFTMDGYWKINLTLDFEGVTEVLDFDVKFTHSSDH